MRSALPGFAIPLLALFVSVSKATEFAESTEVPLPKHAAEACAPGETPVTEDDNAAVYSEWGHLPNSLRIERQSYPHFLRIVKNKAKAGYGLWFCEGSEPQAPDENSVPDYNKVLCWKLAGEELFNEDLSDDVLKDCDLFDKLKNAGFDLPGRLALKVKLATSSYPVIFPQEEMELETFCTGAAQAFNSCFE
jgi:hypothetical protein